jgi:hypothetical protein
VPPSHPTHSHAPARHRRRITRIALALVAVIVCLAGGIGTAAASAATLPPEGIFDNCALDTEMPTCLQRLEAMHQGGLQVVVITANNVSLTSLSTYALAAHVLGMQVMWELSNPGWWQQPRTSASMAGSFPGFASACGCNQDGPLLSFMIRWLAALPGTYGYYAADDSMLAPGDQAGVSSYVSQIKQADPFHTVMIGSADYNMSQQYQGTADMIGTEIYPVTTDPLMTVSDNQSMWDSVGYTAKSAQQLASGDGKQSAFILQAFTFGDNVDDGQAVGVCSPTDTTLQCYSRLRYPSPAEQLELRNEILQNAHPSLILWWSFQGTYGQAGNDTFSIYPTGAVAASRWAGLTAAIQAPAPQATAAAAPQARIATVATHRHKHRRHRRHAARKRSRR